MAGESPDIAERERDQQESGGRTSGPPETVPAETPAPTKRNISGPTPAGEEPAEPAEPADDPEEPAERAGDPDGDGGKTAGSDATMVFSPAAALRRSAGEATASGEGRRDGAAGADPAGPEGGASGTTADADDAPEAPPKKRRATTTAGEATDAGPDATASGAETADAAPGGPRSGAKTAAAAPAVTAAAAASGADAPADAAARAGAAVDSGAAASADASGTDGASPDSGADAADVGASGSSTARGGKAAGSDATMVFSPAAALADDAASASSGGAERGEGTPSGGSDPVPATPRRDAAAGADATLDFSPSPAPSGAVPADPRRDADARGAGAAAEKPGAAAPVPPKPGRAPDAASSEAGEEAAPPKPTAVPPKPGKAPSGPTPAGDAKDADAPPPSTGPSAEGAKPTAKGADLSKPSDAAPAGAADSASAPPKPAEAPAASGKSTAKGADLSKPSDTAPAEGGKPARSASEPPAAPAAPAGPPPVAGAEKAAAPAAPVLPPPPAGPPPVPDSEREPLELLAALTNTPPPPPTPLRTVLRRIKIWSPLVVLLLIIFTVAQSLRPLPEPTLGLTAADTHTFDGEAPTAPWPGSGQAALDVDGIGTFGTSGDQEPVPIASVAKVMTAYLILRDHPMDADPESTGATIPVDQQAEDDVALGDTDDESVVSVTAGDELTQREAIEAIMIASANNVARLLARWDAGSEADFVAKMNETAAELGMKNTTYTDPSGLSPDTVSTAEDQVILGKAAMEDPVFRQIVRMPEYYDSNGERHGNWNHLVPMNGTVGIKTGTTTTALGNLLFAAEQTVGEETRLIVGAVLRQPPDPVDLSILTGALNAGRTLIEFAQQELIEETVLAAGDVVGYVDDGLGGRTPVTVTEDVRAAGWPGLELRVELKAAEDLPHSAAAGTEVGTLTVGDGTGGRETTVPVALAEELTEPGFGAKLRRLG
ncbi:D-alanyl-D-alanine carboxypeptidase [Streptomyces harbinensis]|uniref:D-alanyl-D-alanine carboxypeptidase n=1 Tax=Streptomyces harbinensis TaxID=1176198 RepID=UPI00339266F7